MAVIRFTIYILAFYASLLIPSSCRGHSQHHKKKSALFIFGDSLFDVGNNNFLNTTADYQANFWPYGKSFFKNPTGRFSEGLLIPDIIKNIQGGRKFEISSLAPLGCVPSSRAHKPGNTSTCVEEVTELAKLHNRGLAESLQKLKRHHQGFKYSNPNFFTFLNEESTIQENMVSRKERQHAVALVHTRGIGSCGGKKGVTEYEVCNNVNGYAFFDFVHPTERVNHQVYKLWWSHTPNVTGRHYINLKKLFESQPKGNLLIPLGYLAFFRHN